MIKIYSQVKPDLLLHVIYRPDNKNIHRQNLTPEEEFLQVAFLHLKENSPLCLESLIFNLFIYEKHFTHTNTHI